MIQVEMIPLNKLVPSPKNVGKTGRMVGIEELADNIAAVGLLQNLQVEANATGKFEVVAGLRRLAALKLLAKRKTIAKDTAVPCAISTADGREISLAENIMRLPMHPADQYEAFKALADAGKGPEEIAARFGCSTLVVQQRLKLAAVSPLLLAAYRSEEMDLDQLMAFTVSDDHAAQEKVWTELPAWDRHPATIRHVLTQAHVEASDRRARFVGIDAYVAAGGYVLRDLFTPEHDGYLTDPALLNRLAAEKLEQEAEAVRAEGWKWVEIAAELDLQRVRGMTRAYPERRESNEEQQAEIERLTEAYEALVAEHGEEPPDDVAAELEDISDRIDALSEGNVVWDPADIARAGAIVGIGHAGRAVVERGLLRPEDDVDGAGVDEPRRSSRRERQQKDASQLPDRLIEDLTAHRTAALRVVLGNNPDVALSAVIHALALSAFYHYAGDSCLTLRVDCADLRGSADGIEDTPAGNAYAERHDAWKQRLPAAAEELWGWLVSQEAAARLELLAHCAGGAVDAVQRSLGEAITRRFAHADQLALAVNLDMAQWWKPTAASYLGRVSKARTLDAVREGVSPEAAENLAKLKKDALVALAEERLAGTRWLPMILRMPSVIPASSG
jgi:ParB family transcriptional regulator, chromosome partitioning protein